MRFDLIIQRLTPGAVYGFETRTITQLSQLPGDTEPVERSETVRIYDDYDAIIWNDEKVKKPTLQECEAEWQAITDEDRIAAIDKKRRELYGDFGSQLDMIYWDNKNGTNNWMTHIDTVKADNPK